MNKLRRKHAPKPRICLIQHEPCETPGLLTDVLKACGIRVEMVRVFKENRVPQRIGDFAGLVIMGGPMSVYEQDKHPFLRDEIRLLQDALNKRRPILGICLGSQLLAAALGTRVIPGKQKEIGWHPVTLTSVAAKDGLWRGLPPTFTPLHWHGDVFKLPHGALSLARSELTDCQAFCFSAFAYGLLFHLEVTEPMVRRMTRTFHQELRNAGIPASQITENLLPRLNKSGGLGRRVFARWARLVAHSHVLKKPRHGKSRRNQRSSAKRLCN
jgi:GMP synthase (glutamine-hydrolysing)